MMPLIQKGKNAIQSVFKSANDQVSTPMAIQKRYSPTVSMGYAMSGGTGNAGESIQQFLQKRNLPGQKAAGYFAQQRRQDPQFQVNKRLETGQSVSPRDIQKTNMAGYQTMMGMSTPVQKVPKIDPLTQKEMIGFIDYVRLKQPKSLPAELGATRIAEKFGLRMPKNTPGLANEFDRVLTLMRNRK